MSLKSRIWANARVLIKISWQIAKNKFSKFKISAIKIALKSIHILANSIFTKEYAKPIVVKPNKKNHTNRSIIACIIRLNQNQAKLNQIISSDCQRRRSKRREIKYSCQKEKPKK